MEYADKYIEQNDLPKHTQIESMAQFGETAMFKQFFSDWRDIDATDGLGETHTVGSVAKVEHEDFDASTMHDNPKTAAEICCSSSMGVNFIIQIDCHSFNFIFKVVLCFFKSNFGLIRL